MDAMKTHIDSRKKDTDEARAKMLDSEILDRIGEVNASVIRMETKFDAFISQNHCKDHAERLRKIELAQQSLMSKEDCEKHHAKQSNFRWQSIGVVIALFGVIASLVTLLVSCGAQ